MQVNFSPGKTECVPTFIGTGTKAARLKLKVPMQSTIVVETDAGRVALRCVDEYLYLGTVYHYLALATPNIRYRAQSAESGLYADLSKILRSDWIRTEQKQRVISTMFCTRLLHDAQA